MNDQGKTTTSRLATLLFGALLLPVAQCGFCADVAGVIARLEKYRGPAIVRAESLKRHEVQIDLKRNGESGPLTLFVELPHTGPKVWPLADVEAVDALGKAMLVRRGGIEWHRLWIPIPSGQDRIVVRAVKPPQTPPGQYPEKARQVADPATGLSATIARWPEGRRAALSLRFDDSHPTHLSKAIPILREYGFRGTFMINPGVRDGRPPNSRWRSAFQEHRAKWEAVARQGDQEFANHTARHRGAAGDDDMDSEIGDAARAIWELTPDKSNLTALNLGGGTFWETTRTMRHYLDKYHSFETGGSLGMDDVYGNPVEALRQHLLRHIERGIWCRIHFHYIGEKLSSSEANFRAALDIVRENKADIWIAGMADIYKYQTERAAATLRLERSGPDSLSLALSCSTDPGLFDQPLTLEVTLPESWTGHQVRIIASEGKGAAAKRRTQNGGNLLYFEAAPVNSIYRIEKIK